APDRRADDASGAAAKAADPVRDEQEDKKPLPKDKADEASAVKAVENRGGKVTRDDKLPGKPVIGVNLYGANVTGAGLKELKDLNQLTSLDLHQTQVTDAGLKELKDLKQLTSLNLWGTGVTGAGLKELKDL